MNPAELIGAMAAKGGLPADAIEEGGAGLLSAPERRGGRRCSAPPPRAQLKNSQ